MENSIRRVLRLIWRRLAPPLPVLDPLDHPDIRRMSRHDLDDLPIPRYAEKNGVPEIEPLCK